MNWTVELVYSYCSLAESSMYNIQIFATCLPMMIGEKPKTLLDPPSILDSR